MRDSMAAIGMARSGSSLRRRWYVSTMLKPGTLGAGLVPIGTMGLRRDGDGKVFGMIDVVFVASWIGT